MKKLRFIIVFISFLLLACDTPVSNTDIPIIKKVIVSDSASNLTSGVEKDTFFVGDSVYFGLTITDTGLDLDKVVITQKSASQNIEPIEMSISTQLRDTDFYYANMTASIPEIWTIEGYAVDDKGNKSNTVTKQITVNEIVEEKYSITYDLNEGSGNTPIDSNEYTAFQKIIAKSAVDIHRDDYFFKHWASNREGSQFIVQQGKEFTLYNMNSSSTDIVNSTLYAIWYQLISNISYTIDGETVRITWQNPTGFNYTHINLETNFVLVDGSIVPIPQTANQKFLDKDINTYEFAIPNSVDYEYINVKLCTHWRSGGGYSSPESFDPPKHIQIYDKVVNIPPAEVTNVSHKVNYYGGTTFNLTKPIDKDLEFILFIWPWGAEHIYRASAETFNTQYSPEQLEYVTIKTIDKSGNISNGIIYNLE